MLKLWVAAFGTYLLGARARHALRRRAAGRARLRAQPEDGHLADLPAHERLDASYPWLLLLRRPAGASGPDLLAGAGAGGGGRRCSSSPGTPSRASTRCSLRRRSSRCGCGRRAASAAPARAAAQAAAGLRAARSCRRRGAGRRQPDPVRRAAAAVGRLRRPARGVDRPARSPLKEVIGLFLPDYWGRPTQTPIRPFLLERAMYVGALPLMLAAAALILRADASSASAVAVVRRRSGSRWCSGVPPFAADRDPAARVQLRPQHAADRLHDARGGAAGGLGARRRSHAPRSASRRAPRLGAGAGRRCWLVAPPLSVVASAAGRRSRRRSGEPRRSPGCSPTRPASFSEPGRRGRDPGCRR